MLSRLVTQGYFKKFDPKKARKSSNAILNIIDINSSLLLQKSMPVAIPTQQTSSSSSSQQVVGGEEEMKSFGFLSAQEEKLVYHMYRTLETDESGMGLAAPQVSVLKRIFLGAKQFDVEEVYDEQLKANVSAIVDMQMEAYINPRILDSSKEMLVDVEGCLSMPDMFSIIKRPAQIRVEYYNLMGERRVEDLEGIPARIFQHELDHLDGVIMLQRITDRERDMFHLRRWEEFLDPAGNLKPEIMEKYK